MTRQEVNEEEIELELGFSWRKVNGILEKCGVLFSTLTVEYEAYWRRGKETRYLKEIMEGDSVHACILAMQEVLIWRMMV
jgi:hypothetical protein